MSDTVAGLSISEWEQVLVVVVPIVASLAIGWYFWRRPERELLTASATVTHVRSLEQKVPGLEIRYGGSPVPAVSLSKVVLWNAGSKAIRHENVAEADPLRIETIGGAKILAVSAPFKGNAGNAIRVEWDASRSPEKVRIEFDYLNAGEGVALQVLHTGESGVPLQCRGSLIDAVGPTSSRQQRKYTGLLLMIPFFALIVVWGRLTSGLGNSVLDDGLFFLSTAAIIVIFVAYMHWGAPWLQRHISPVPIPLQPYLSGESFLPDASQPAAS
jgi:hypothetical protein